jgi:gamma-glutamyltranspeptidase/glutathione hydrolase
LEPSSPGSLESLVPQATAGRTPEGHLQRVCFARGGVVASAHWRASEVGAQLLAQGGNAVDAAVGAALALGVCEPAASGLGGQTMLTIHAPGLRTTALDGSSRAPHRTPPSELSSKERLRGHRATTVPSTVATLAYALERFGSLSWSKVLEPAIAMAREGVAVTALQNFLTRRELKHLKVGTAGALFLDRGRPLPEGALLRQPVLAATLERLAREGWEDFYRGGIAAEIARDMREHDGLIQADDLAQIPRPIERRPLAGSFRGSRVFTFPPPGAGNSLLYILKLAEQLPAILENLDRSSGAVLFAKVVQRAMLDRQDRPFDPSYFHQVKERLLLSDDHARKVARSLRAKVKTKGETTHLSVMDSRGGAVALTQSIERVYGSFAASPRLGFLYNNYMSAFEHSDIAHPYFLRPNAAPWASVAPTIVMRGRRPWLAIGSPGSERIVSSIAQVLIRLQHGSLSDAIAAPRLHASHAGHVRYEGSRMGQDIPVALADAGFELQELEPFSFALGCVQAVQRHRDGWLGVADLRRDGAACGATA